MNKPVYFTICSRNYLGYALTLGRSLHAADPEAVFILFLADVALEPHEAEDVEFESVPVDALCIETLSDMALRYSIMEFNTAIKPACFQYLFERGHEAAVYLDPDIMVLRPLVHVEELLAAGANLVLTPHSLKPLDDGGDPDDLRLLRTGTFNLGFAAFRSSAETHTFLDWWRARLRVDCRVALDDGIFVDQKWMDLAPCYLAHTRTLRHPGYNAAYWNLLGRPITRAGQDWFADGEPLHFFHFSGVVPGNGLIFSKHQNRFAASEVGDLSHLLETYLRALQVNGQSDWARVPYGFALDQELAGLDSFVRGVFRRLHPEPVADDVVADFALDQACNEPAAALRGQSGEGITNLGYEIWAQRPDLRRSFDLSSSRGRSAYRVWLLTSGVTEHRIPARFLPRQGAETSQEEGERALGLKARLVHEVLKRRALVKPALELLPQNLVSGLRRRLQRIVSSGVRSTPELNGTGDAEASAPPRAALAVYGYFAAESGLGEAVRREFAALRGAGLPALARPVRAARAFQDRQAFDSAFEDRVHHAEVHLIHVNADQVIAREHWATPEMFSPEHYRIGYWAWELDTFPLAWSSAFDWVDEIWVPSQFVADAIAARTSKPVHVFPHPIPVCSSAPDRTLARRRFALPIEGVLFLTAFDFNSYVERKNPMAVLEAVERASAQRSDIHLILKCHGGVSHDRVRAQIMRRARSLPNVHIIDQVLDGAEMELLYAASDGLISLHRSEGFGLTLAEAMARAMPVIATDYSGSSAFFDASVGEAIPYRLVSVAEAAYPHAAGSMWADPDINAAAAALVRLAADEAYRNEVGRKGMVRIEERLSPVRIGRAMAERIDAILAARRRVPD